jgi:hypothetical protein
MPKIMLRLAFFAGLLLPAALLAQQGFVHTTGTQIVDEHGKPANAARHQPGELV